MSKAQLKKELSGMTAGQLVEVILDAYAARPAIKEYFEYFLNPDVEKVFDKQMRIIVKETNRSKYHSSKARVSIINKAIKEFTMHGPDDEMLVRFLYTAVHNLAVAEMMLEFSDTHWSLVSKIVSQALTVADSAGFSDKLLVQLTKLASEDSKIGTRWFKRHVKDTVEGYNTTKALDPVKR
ncbi:MAG: DUF6155 family protein [Clostridiales bacterium]|nr:DUF6155 family protein [Clostridiales bacterium]